MFNIFSHISGNFCSVSGVSKSNKNEMLMKKNLLFGLACFFSVGTVMATGITSDRVIEEGTEMHAVTPENKKKKAAPAEIERTFHIARCNEANKVLLMVGKKPNTKVRVRIFDKDGTLVYSDVISAKRDYSAILNLEEIDGAVIKLSDSNGLEKNYTL